MFFTMRINTLVYVCAMLSIDISKLIVPLNAFEVSYSLLRLNKLSSNSAGICSRYRHPKTECTTGAVSSMLNAAAINQTAGSAGVELLIGYLNSDPARQLISKLAMSNQALSDEAQRMNFWTGGNFVVQRASCTGILKEGLKLRVDCMVRGSVQHRDVVIQFPSVVNDEVMLKNVLVQMATKLGRLQDTGAIMQLPFGMDASMPLDFKFNNVPHPAWVRSYLYDAAAEAVLRAVSDTSIQDKSRLQMRVNFPEVNPAFDTYRIGTLLEMVRTIALRLAEQRGLRVRVCVQQSLGEGIFTGLPLALSSMRPVLESMDWGQQLSEEEKFRKSDNSQPRKEALIRLGAVGADQVATDDDVLLLIAPQNVIGGMIVNLLEDMVKAAAGRPLILLNPQLADKPSSNNMMQIRGRSERKAFENSFRDIYALRLLYPSSGGYMYPIRGMIAKKDFHSPWVAYSKEGGAGDKERYRMIAAFDPYMPPDPTVLSEVFTTSRDNA